MKFKYYFINLITTITCSCKSSYYHVAKFNSNAEVVKRGKIESVIFSKDANCFLYDFGELRFTPSVDDINMAEYILQRNIQSANTMHNQGDGCPLIHKNLKNYRRQYYGYIDSEGNKILYVNFLWAKYSIFDRLKGYHKDDSHAWKSERVIVLDGCSNYWSIEINLSQQKLQHMYINGSA